MIYNAIRNTLSAFIFILFLFPLHYAYAADDTSLYQARIPIEARDIKTRNQGFLKGIKQVLQKLSGQQKLPANANKVLKNPEQWVQQFSYETIDEKNYLLLIDFDRIAIDTLMKKLQLPVWAGKRPTLLAWVSVLEEGKQERIITPEDYPVYAKHMLNTAQNAGLTLLMPVLDLADRQLNPQHVYTGKSQAFTALQQRYGVEAIVSAQIKQVNDTWNTTWHFKHATQLSWQAKKDKNLTTFIEAGIQRALQRLHPQMAANTTKKSGVSKVAENTPPPSLSTLNKLAENHIQVKIKGVNSLAHYQMIQQQLNRITALKTVSLYDLQAEYAIFNIEVEGGTNKLKQALSPLTQFTLQDNASLLTYYFNP